VNEYLPNPRTLKMVSNLPYYITTPILFHFLEAPLFFSRIVVMVQEEVALRMAAGVNTRDYGVLTLALRLHADVDVVHRVPSTCFAPRPKVDSCIVRLRCLTEPRYPDVPGDMIMRLVRTAFSQRRKTLRNSLGHSAIAGLNGPTVLAAAEAAEIDLSRRPQTLSLDEFAAIGRNLIRLKAEEPTAGE
jgi:16S rRNA (adenine1518-N6/adenine1519-N6)-dimethyltransferase